MAASGSRGQPAALEWHDEVAMGGACDEVAVVHGWRVQCIAVGVEQWRHCVGHWRRQRWLLVSSEWYVSTST